MRILVVLCLAMACGAPAPSSAPATDGAATAAGHRTDTDVAGLQTALAGGAVLIDVRTPEEFAAGHVPGAVNVPMGGDPAANPTLTSHDKAEPIYVICQSGGRSSRASDTLASLGFQAVNVKGGTAGWVAAGHAVEP